MSNLYQPKSENPALGEREKGSEIMPTTSGWKKGTNSEGRDFWRHTDGRKTYDDPNHDEDGPLGSARSSPQVVIQGKEAVGVADVVVDASTIVYDNKELKWGDNPVQAAMTRRQGRRETPSNLLTRLIGYLRHKAAEDRIVELCREQNVTVIYAYSDQDVANMASASWDGSDEKQYDPTPYVAQIPETSRVLVTRRVDTPLEMYITAKGCEFWSNKQPEIISFLTAKTSLKEMLTDMPEDCPACVCLVTLPTHQPLEEMTLKYAGLYMSDIWEALKNEYGDALTRPMDYHRTDMPYFVYAGEKEEHVRAEITFMLVEALYSSLVIRLEKEGQFFPLLQKNCRPAALPEVKFSYNVWDACVLLTNMYVTGAGNPNAIATRMEKEAEMIADMTSRREPVPPPKPTASTFYDVTPHGAPIKNPMRAPSQLQQSVDNVLQARAEAKARQAEGCCSIA